MICGAYMLSHLEAPGSPMTEEDSTDFRAKEMRWLSEHRGEFAGQWIVMSDSQKKSGGNLRCNPINRRHAFLFGNLEQSYKYILRQFYWMGLTHNTHLSFIF
jgi:hypothetical protein